MIIRCCGTMVLLVLLSLYLPAQYYKRSQADSLLTMLSGQTEKDRVHTLLHLSDCYYHLQLDTALIYASKALEESERIGYDWGYYKSLSLELRVKSHYQKQSELEQPILKCVRWFKENGYLKDQLWSKLEYTRCVTISKTLKESKQCAQDNLEEAKSLRNFHLLGKAWYNLYEIQLGEYTRPDYRGSLDSAYTVFQDTNDSLWIMRAHLKKMEHGNLWSEKESLKRILKRVKQWNNTYLTKEVLGLVSCVYAIQRQPDSALYYGNQHLLLAKAYGGNRATAYANYLMGMIYKIRGRAENAIPYYQKSAQLNDELGAHLDHYEPLKALGGLFEAKKEYRKAINCYIQAMELAQMRKNQVQIHFTKATLAKLYLVTQDYDKAEHLFWEVIHYVNQEVKGRIRVKMNARLYEQLAEVYLKKGNVMQSLRLLDSAAACFQQVDRRGMHLIAIRKMSLYLDMDSLSNAKKIHSSILEQKDRIHFTEELRLQEGRLFFALQQYAKSIKALNQFITTTQQVLHSEDHLLAYRLLYESSKQLRKYNEALNYLERYKWIDDSIKKANAIENIQLIQSKYEMAEKEADLEKANQEKKLKEFELQQKNDELAIGRLYNVLLLLIILFIGGVVFWRNHRMKLKKAKEALQLQAEKLELEHEKKEAQQKVELAQLKDDLFANVSHELRTPLTLIEVPIKKYLKKAAKSDQPLFRSVLDNTHHLLELIDEMLELSRLESGQIQLQMQSVELDLFIQQIKVNFAPLFKDKFIDFAVHNTMVNGCLKADQNRLKVVLNNLLKNAYHHCPSKGQVTLEVLDASHTAGEGWSIIVTNTGKPLSDQQAKAIFERHYRTDEEQYTGSGIGLTLSRQIVEMHGGTLTVDNKQPGKTVFQMVLPHHILQPEQSVNPARQIANEVLTSGDNPELKTRAKVLVVEDHLEMQKLVLEILQPTFQVLIACNGIEGEQMARDHQPDLILSDVMMPHKDGFELLQSIKQNIHTSHIPVVLLTARADVSSRIQGFDQDADEYISKPFDPETLLARMKNLLRQRQQLQQMFIQKPQLRVQATRCTTLDQDFIDRALTTVEKYYNDGEFTVERFCKELALNRNSVHNKLKALTGQSASQYIQTYRLTKAGELLLSTQRNISDIAINTGFNNRQVFNKGFRKHFGLTPSEYRKEK